MNAIPPLLLCAPALFQQACAPAAPRVARGKVATQANSPRPAASPSASFDEYARAEFAPADGFDFPFGDGEGGGATDLGQPVYSVANGRAVFAENCGRLWGNVAVLEHLFYENHERREIRSLYAHLNEMKVRAHA